MTPLIKQRIQQGRLVLFLGAGASVGCRDKQGNEAAPLGGRLKEELGKLAGLEDSEDEDLQDVYSAASRILGFRMQALLENNYSRLNPSRELLTLAYYPWPRIYTTNIDDAFHTSLVSKSSQRISPRSRFSPAAPTSDDMAALDLIFLNGYVNWPSDGYIFSATEYARAQTAKLPWFVQLIRDFYDFTFLFVGTRLKESIFYHHLAEHAQTTTSSIGRSYLLLPNISSTQKERLSELNIDGIEGTLDDFSSWLNQEFPSGLSREAVLTNRLPILSIFDQKRASTTDLALFENVQVILRANLPSAMSSADLNSSTVEFYRGFKPTWREIVSAVPAELDILAELMSAISGGNASVTLVRGPMGCGKTTLLMQAALKLSDAGHAVYYVDGPIDDLRAVIDTFEASHDRYYLFIERISRLDRQVRRCFQENVLVKGRIIAAEREAIWENKSSELLNEYSPKLISQHEISANDADSILEKLHKYAPTVGLLRLGQRERRRLLLEHARKQLLIGLLEATYGIGYKRMISAEFESLDQDARDVLLLVGLATHHDLHIGRRVIETILRERSDIAVPFDSLLAKLSGIVRENNSQLFARHPVYIREIVRGSSAREESERALVRMLSYFSTLPTPITVHKDRIGTNLVDLFKKVINHSFVAMLLKAPDRVLGFYRQFERSFSADGLYWLQMGLAYRGVGKQDEALQSLETALALHPIEHTKHAIAQQKLICSSKLAISGDSTKARAFLDDGIACLQVLDNLDNLLGGRYYPIVALSEGHVFVVKTLEGDVPAKAIAKQYADELAARLTRDGAIFRGNSGSRLTAPQYRAKKALQRLNKYVLDGRWEFGSDLASIMTTDLPDSRIP